MVLILTGFIKRILAVSDADKSLAFGLLILPIVPEKKVDCREIEKQWEKAQNHDADCPCVKVEETI